MIFIMTFSRSVQSKIAFITKKNLFPQKLAAKNVKLEKILQINIFPLWTVKLLFVIFGRLSYTFLKDKICNLSVQPVYYICYIET